MSSFSEKELLNALAQWVGKMKTPYSNLNDGHSGAACITLATNSPGARVEVKTLGNYSMEFCCIHNLFDNQEINDIIELRQECHQFNSLMETVRIPAYIWENEHTGSFELRWQEALNTYADLALAQRIFDQSLYLANTLDARLGWKQGSHYAVSCH